MNIVALEEALSKAIKLACHYQNRCCDLEEIIEMFCLDAEAAQEITTEPVAYVNGPYGGYPTYRTVDPSIVLPMNMALFARPVSKPQITMKVNDSLIGISNA